MNILKLPGNEDVIGRGESKISSGSKDDCVIYGLGLKRPVTTAKLYPIGGVYNSTIIRDILGSKAQCEVQSDLPQFRRNQNAVVGNNTVNAQNRIGYHLNQSAGKQAVSHSQLGIDPKGGTAIIVVGVTD